MLVTQKEYAEIHNIKFSTVREAVRRGCIKSVKTENGRRLIDSDDPWCLKHKTRMENLGFSYSRLHNIWSCMKQRCYNSKHIGYKNYGGRGVVVCDEWKDSAQAFCEWAVTHGYADDLEIDRIDVNGNYEPSNCRWVTHKANANNRRPRQKKVREKQPPRPRGRKPKEKRHEVVYRPERVIWGEDFTMSVYRLPGDKLICRISDDSNIVTWCEFYPGLRGIY